MAIEKLDRYMASSHGEINETGAFVLYKEARAREDALLKALKQQIDFGYRSDYQTRKAACEYSREIIRQIEATR